MQMVWRISALGGTCAAFLVACIPPVYMGGIHASPPQQVALDASAAMTGPHDFDWTVSGDSSIAPSQVFSTPLGVWLQFSSSASVPAILGVRGDAAPVLLNHRFLAPYIFVQGVWPTLVFRAGRQHAAATRGGSMHFSALDNAAHPPIQRETQGASTRVLQFDISTTDATMRETLARWAQQVGWTFSAAHWAVSVDIPLTARAEFGTDFRSAVTALLASSEMSDTPVQPCFYSNKVLRVVGLAQQCDPRVLPAGLSSQAERS